MIVRTGRRIPGVVPVGGVHAPISIVRMAVGDAYGAKEWREGEGDDEAAFRTERIERRICHAVAEFAFRQAERTGAKVFGGPKYTVSPIYEGMLKEEMDAAAARHDGVPYEPQLIDATFALLIASTGDPLVIPSLNRDGDILSDLVLPLFGSIAGSESLLVAFAEDFEPDALMAEAAHGTAPSLEGKNVANPMAMILAGSALLTHMEGQAREAGRAIREASFEAVSQGVRTADLGGHASTTEFTDEVIGRGPLEARRLVEPPILLADRALAQVVHAEEEQDRDACCDAGADQPPLLDRVRGRMAEVVRDQADRSAQQIPPAAFQRRKRHQDMRVIPAIHAPKTRRTATKRARKIVFPPCALKKRSVGGMYLSRMRRVHAHLASSLVPPLRPIQ